MQRIIGVLILSFFGLLHAACGETGKTYATIEDARSVRLFERGWLPDILPPSAHSIAVRTDLYLGAADGRFEFQERDSGVFFAKVSPAAIDPRWKPEWKEFHAQWSRSGYQGYTFANDMSTWLFMCARTEGGSQHCVWLKRSNG